MLFPVHGGLHAAIFLSDELVSKKGMLLFSFRVKTLLPVGSTEFMCCYNLSVFPMWFWI